MDNAKKKTAPKTSYPSDDQEKFMLRMPLGMRDKIKAAAAANKRSMNSEINAVLQEKYPVYDATGMVRVVRKLFAMDSKERADAFEKLDKLGHNQDPRKNAYMISAIKLALRNMDSFGSKEGLELDDIMIQYWLAVENPLVEKE